MNQQINVVYPNAVEELKELKSMSCSEIKLKNSLGGYWTKSNGEFARDKIDVCKIDDQNRKDFLKNIKQTGTSLEKKKAGFKTLWFGDWSHTELAPPHSQGKLIIPKGTSKNAELLPDSLLVINNYNNTITFINNDIVPHMVQSSVGAWHTSLIQPNGSETMTINHIGAQEYFLKPDVIGQMWVVPFGDEFEEEACIDLGNNEMQCDWSKINK